MSTGVNSYRLFLDTTLFGDTCNTTQCLRMFKSWGSLRNQVISYHANLSAISPALKTFFSLDPTFYLQQ